MLCVAFHRASTVSIDQPLQVKRHIRLIDHAIVEQKASIQNGAQAYLEKVTMPEKWSNRTQNVMSDDSEDELPPPPSIEPEIIAPPEPATARRGKRKRSTAPAEEQLTSLKITLPAAPITYTPESTDPDEPKYCYCERISFGEVRLASLGWKILMTWSNIDDCV